jgi:hypothetical protein
MTMFDAYTRRAIDALSRAARAAREYGHEELGPAHLVLGVMEAK